MIRILFVCHGNICRSPMAEFVMKDLAKKAGAEHDFYVESAATSDEEIGNDIHSGTRSILIKYGISFEKRAARRVTKADYTRFDMIVAMDLYNVANLKYAFGDDPDGKISLLLDHAGRPGRGVADPWYTGEFEATYRDVLDGCRGILNEKYSKK